MSGLATGTLEATVLQILQVVMLPVKEFADDPYFYHHKWLIRKALPGCFCEILPSRITVWHKGETAIIE